jgi:hypothetical protein
VALQVTMVPVENQEGIQVLHYEHGQKYEPHNGEPRRRRRNGLVSRGLGAARVHAPGGQVDDRC